MSREKTISKNFIWRILERFGAQGVTLIVTIILARIIDPNSYGIVAIITVITTILQVFVDSGFGTALIRKKDADVIDFSTIFFLNIIICSALYVVLFFVAPFISVFYNNSELTILVRISGLILFISGFKNIQVAYISRNLLFKKFFFATLAGTVIAGIVGITMAYKGYGVWALITQNLANQFVDTIILWIISGWRPKLVFSIKRLRSLFSFGWKILIAALIDTIWNDLRQLIIGKKYSNDNLAYYNKGQEYPRYGVTAINSSIDSVMLPAMGNVQNDIKVLKGLTRKAIKIGSFILWPVMMGIAACAEPIVSLLLTDKWLPCVLFMRVFCVVYAFYPIHTANLNAIKAMGRSDLFLTLEIIKKAIGLGLILGFMWISVEAMAYSCIISSVCSQIINSWPNKKLLKYSYLEQLKDILPSIGLSVFMAGCVYCVGFLHLNNWLTLLIQIPLGAIIYIVGAKLFKFEAFDYMLSIVKGFLKKRKSSLKATSTSMPKQKKILLLGGSAQQVIAIETAKKLGYYTVLCDYLTDNPGQYVADKFYLVSTTDKEAVLKVATDEKVDGILAYASDPAAPTAAYVAEKLNLPGNPYESVEILCNKDKFRAFLAENGFNTPKAKGFESIEQAMDDDVKNSFELPVIIKPVDSSGSKGVTVLRTWDEYEKAVEYAFSFSRGKRIIVEEFIEKKHPYLVGGDIFVIDGKVTIWGLMNCHRDSNVNPLVPVGKSYPLQMEESDVEKIKETLTQLVDKLSIKNGAMNVELVIDKNDRVFLIDVGPRGGGNMIPDLMGMIFSVDVVEMSVKSAMNEQITNVMTEGIPYYATHNVHSDRDGILKKIIFSEELENYIIKKALYNKPGDKVEYFDNAPKTLGIIFMKFPDSETMVQMLGNINSHIRIELE